MTLPDGSSPAGDFVDTLSEADRRKIDVLFARMADHGQIRNREKFKKVENSDQVFEFKSHQIRILCFFVPRGRLVLALGLRKKSDKLPPAEVRRAEEYR